MSGNFKYKLEKYIRKNLRYSEHKGGVINAMENSDMVAQFMDYVDDTKIILRAINKQFDLKDPDWKMLLSVYRLDYNENDENTRIVDGKEIKEKYDFKINEMIYSMLAKIRIIRHSDWPKDVTQKYVNAVLKRCGGLLELELPNNYNFPVVIQDNVKKVVMGNKFDSDITFTDDSKCEEIIFCYAFNKPIKIPNGVNELIFKTYYNNNITWGSNPRIKKIQFGARYNLPLIVPDSVEELIFGREFDSDVIWGSNPRVKKLIFYISYNQPTTIPDSVKELEFGVSFNSDISWGINPQIKKIRLYSKSQLRLIPDHILSKVNITFTL